MLATTSASVAAGDNVVLIAVNKVDAPAKLPGQCDVAGTIIHVLQVTAFRPRQVIMLKVPCRGDEASFIPAVALMNGGQNVYFQSAKILKESHLGLARLDNSGAPIWKGSTRVFGPWGTAYGYRVVDGAAMPAN